ncbi:LysR family transcriptional regulator [Bordetella sp. 02P26C-1]|uniref:LysR family transcriptional regulator n=1 Tax=Bordetella sp. 02P26C-1 TaxID=2683195 RepID=UPI001355CF8C|nr:LysR family transcriptional regulator [Bordetella sp. 02P26C-1]MVW80664.1 LysR family transcriptional regulator [Bordetella sp. 02P26C-1]
MKELNQARLRYMHEVIVCGSIRGAAEKLEMSPSVISRQIQLLEKEIGLPLFERRARGLAPTDAAEMLEEFLRGYRAQHEHLQDRLQELRGMRRGHVELSISEGMIEALMQYVMGPFCQEFPNIRVGINTASVDEVVEAVRTDRVHIGLAFNPPVHPEVRIRARQALAVGALVRADHPLARKRRPITVKDLMQHPLALMTAPYGLRRIVELLEFTEKIHISPALTTNSLGVLRQYALAGAGAVLMTDIGASLELSSGELVLVPIAHPVLRQAEMQLMVRLGRPLSSAATEMLRRIESRLPLFSGHPRRGVRGDAIGV